MATRQALRRQGRARREVPSQDIDRILRMLWRRIEIGRRVRRRGRRR